MRAKRSLRLENLEEREVFTTLPGLDAGLAEPVYSSVATGDVTGDMVPDIIVRHQTPTLPGDDGPKNPTPEVRSRVSELVLAASAFMADERATDQVMMELGERLTDDGGFVTPFDAVSRLGLHSMAEGESSGV